ncbi:hypothetical protein PAXRUDRAFT_178204, partial [Paxillus rubicundulus Ve08.2h10]
YLVSWKGYPSSKNSWECTGNLTHAKEVLNAYKKACPRDFPETLRPPHRK